MNPSWVIPKDLFHLFSQSVKTIRKSHTLVVPFWWFPSCISSESWLDPSIFYLEPWPSFLNNLRPEKHLQLWTLTLGWIQLSIDIQTPPVIPSEWVFGTLKSRKHLRRCEWGFKLTPILTFGMTGCLGYICCSPIYTSRRIPPEVWCLDGMFWGSSHTQSQEVFA